MKRPEPSPSITKSPFQKVTTELESMKREEANSFIPRTIEYYYPTVVRRLMARIDTESYDKIALFGFCENMKWLYRLLRECGQNPVLCDWRNEFIGYDCGGDEVLPVKSLIGEPLILVVICIEEIHELKAAMRYLFENELNQFPVIYDREQPYAPLRQQQPYKGIIERAEARAKSMISDSQLFDLIQYIRLTSKLPGDVVEYGSFMGGSGAVIVEAVNYFGKRPVWLFDSFEGIPKSRFGLDHRWNGSFSNSSFREVADAFRDCDHVKVVKGNITETYSQAVRSISFGYLASDTLETGELLLNYMWPKLDPGGIICICDYGSFPNCLPLSMFTDKFFEGKDDALIFYPDRVGIFIMKKS